MSVKRQLQQVSIEWVNKSNEKTISYQEQMSLCP